MMIAETDVRLAGKVQRFEHWEPFLRLISVERLHYRAVHGITQSEMTSILRGLAVPAERVGSPPRTHMVYVFSSDADGRGDQLDKSDVHGVLLFADQPNAEPGHDVAYAVDYFEPDRAGTLERIESISCTMHQPPGIDDIRALHYATFDPTALPAHSTIYEFRSDSFSRLATSRDADRELRFRLLGDQSRWGGLHTAGLYGRELYTSFALMLDNDPTPGICGNMDGCQAGDSDCVPDPIAGYTCQEVSPPDGSCTAVAEALAASRLPMSERVNFGTLRLLHEDLLRQSSKGRDYIATYYTLTMFARTDRRVLWKYLKALPHFNRAIGALLVGSDDEIIVTPQLRDAVVELVHDHRDIDDSRLQLALDVVERDIKMFAGQRRVPILEAMEIPSTAEDHR